MTSLVDTLLKNSDIPPIIIIQSDHGAKIYDLDSNNYARVRMSNLNALYLPEGGDKHLYDSISLINTFPIIFNHYFCGNYKLLNDDIYISNSHTPYKFNDVTQLLKRYQNKSFHSKNIR